MLKKVLIKNNTCMGQQCVLETKFRHSNTLIFRKFIFYYNKISKKKLLVFLILLAKYYEIN